jgi:hypothetical protein
MTTEHPGHSMAEIILANLRRAGWTVAVHNDFRLGGKPHTFWLFTHEATRKYAKGEGTSDQEALEEAAHEAAMATDAPVRMAEPTLPGEHVPDLEAMRRALTEAGAWLDSSPNDPLDGIKLIRMVTTLHTQLRSALWTIETRFAAPDEFEDAEEAGNALRAGEAAFVSLEGYRTLLLDFHKTNHDGALGECTVPICIEANESGSKGVHETSSEPALCPHGHGLLRREDGLQQERWALQLQPFINRRKRTEDTQ